MYESKINVMIFKMFFSGLISWICLNLSFCFEVLHVSGQIDIMCQELKEISSVSKSSSVSTKTLVARHQKIISLSKKIENYFSLVALLQFVWNTFVICALSFMVVIVSKTALAAAVIDLHHFWDYLKKIIYFEKYA